MTESTANSLMSEGTQHLSAQNFAAAKACFLQVLEIDSKESEAYFLLSWIAHNENQTQLACDYLKKANSIQPFNKKYLLGLANVYSQLGEFQKAIELYQGYLRMDSSKAEIFYQYACTLSKVKELALAFEAFQKAISLDPNQLPFYMAFGQLLYQINQNRNAQKVYLSALRQGLKSEGLYQNIAKLHADFGELEESKRILLEASNAYPENLAFIYRLSSLDSEILTPSLLNKLNTQEEESLTPENQFYRHWLLSKFHAKENEHHAEMQRLQQAHSKFTEISPFPFQKEIYLKTLSQLELPPIKNVDLLNDEEHKALEPIFIVGVPRCGSTLLENIICSGTEHVLKGEETGALFHSVTRSLQNNNSGTSDDDFWVSVRDQAKAFYQNANLLKDNLLKDSARFTDKSLENIYFVDLILSIYPKAKIVYCERHPLASIISIMKNNMVTLPWAHDVGDIFEYVDNSMNAMAKWQAQFPENILSVQYENLVVDPENESKKLMAFCGLEWHESCLNFHQNKDLMSKTASHIQIREKINQNALNTHQKYATYFQDYADKYAWLK